MITIACDKKIKYQSWKLDEIVRVSFILINNRVFDFHPGYKIILKFMTSIHPLNKFIKNERLITVLTSINKLRNKKKLSIKMGGNMKGGYTKK